MTHALISGGAVDSCFIVWGFVCRFTVRFLCRLFRSLPLSCIVGCGPQFYRFRWGMIENRVLQRLKIECIFMVFGHLMESCCPPYASRTFLYRKRISLGFDTPMSTVSWSATAKPSPHSSVCVYTVRVRLERRRPEYLSLPIRWKLSRFLHVCT